MSGWVAGAIVVGAVVGAASSYNSSKEEKKSAKRAIEAQEYQATTNLEFQKELAAEQREDFAPWQEAGEEALIELKEGIASGAFEVGNVDVTQDPGYQFRMDQGVKALDQSAAARGRLLSGAQQKGINEYAQNIGSQEYANAYARESNEKARRYNMLSGMSSLGQASAAKQAGATQNLAQAGGNIMSNLGNAQAQSEMAQGQARAGAYQGVATAGNQAVQNWLTYKTANNNTGLSNPQMQQSVGNYYSNQGANLQAAGAYHAPTGG